MKTQPRRRTAHGAAAPWIFAAFAAVGLFFLLTEHRAHLFGWLPFLLLAACPLMHFFHGRHGGHDRADHRPTAHDKPALAADEVPSKPQAPPAHRHH